MSAKFTPGPWCVGRVEFSTTPGMENALAVFGEKKHKQTGTVLNSCTVCVVSPAGFCTNQDKANARLIAAAPELLTALESVLEVVEARVRGAELSDGLKRLHDARTAIANAKGGAS